MLEILMDNSIIIIFLICTAILIRSEVLKIMKEKSITFQQLLSSTITKLKDDAIDAILGLATILILSVVLSVVVFKTMLDESIFNTVLLTTLLTSTVKSKLKGLLKRS